VAVLVVLLAQAELLATQEQVAPMAQVEMVEMVI